MRAFTITPDGELLLTREAREQGKAGTQLSFLTWGHARAVHAHMHGRVYDPGPASKCQGCGRAVYASEDFECWLCTGDRSWLAAGKDARSYRQDDYQEVGVTTSEEDDAASPLFLGMEA